MPFEFVLIELDSGSVSAGDRVAEENLRELRTAFAQSAGDKLGKHKVREQVYRVSEKDPLPDLVNEHSVAVLCGNASEEHLLECCQQALSVSAWPLVLMDSFRNRDSLESAFSKIESKYIQLIRIGALFALMKSGRNFLYAYEKSDCTATVCLLFDEGTQVLVIERLHDPFAGRNALPGGFLRVQLESLEECAYRELEEECGLKMKKGEMLLIDLRSSPARDPRAHIVDAGYGAMIGPERKEELLKQLIAGDDASKAHLMPVEELLKDDALAFDHGLCLRNTLRHFGLRK